MNTVKQIEAGLAEFLDSELMPKLPDGGIQRVITGTAMGLLVKQSGNIIAEYGEHPFVKMLGIVDDKGDWDLETLKEELKKQFPKNGVDVDVPMVGTLTFKTEDVDKIYDYINKN